MGPNGGRTEESSEGFQINMQASLPTSYPSLKEIELKSSSLENKICNICPTMKFSTFKIFKFGPWFKINKYPSFNYLKITLSLWSFNHFF